MQIYYVECFKCDLETQVVSNDGEPEYCPMCGSEINAQLIEEEEDSDNF